MASILSAYVGHPYAEYVFIALAAAGVLSLIKTVSSFLDAIFVMFLRPGKNLKKLGSWAIVTGATDGIGKGYAKEFARKKINVILVSRTQSKLEEVAKELESKYKVETKIVAVDFSKPDEVAKGYAAIQSLVDQLEVGILVNNVGVSYPYAMYLHEMDDELVQSIISVNIDPLTRLTKMVIPGMVKRKRGAIVNIGSGAASVIPSDPLYSVYAGTKA